MKGSSRRDALTAKFLLPPYALESSASTVGPKPSGGRCTGIRALFARVRSSPAPGAGLSRGLGEMKTGYKRSPRVFLLAWSGPVYKRFAATFGARCGGGETRAQGSCASSGLCSPAPPDQALEEVAYHWLFIRERASREGEESESLPASSH